MEIAYGAAFFAGLLSFLSPCVLPLAPPYLCYLSGISLDQMLQGASLTRGVQWYPVRIAVIFTLGFTTVFVLLGMSASFIGRLLSEYMGVLTQIAGFFIICMGLHMLGIFRLELFYREWRYQGNLAGGTYIGAYLMGLAFAFGWTPCIGPILAAILLLAANGETAYQGAALLGVYSLGLSLPFVFLSMAIGSTMVFLNRFRSYLRILESVTGFFLIVAGIAFVTGRMNEVSFFLLETFPSLGRFG